MEQHKSMMKSLKISLLLVILSAIFGTSLQAQNVDNRRLQFSLHTGLAVQAAPQNFVDYWNIGPGAGILAVVIGIASQEVLANIMGGTFIVLFKPFKVDDTVQINDVVGRIEDITLRHTVVNNFQNKRIVIPNAVINKEQIINYNLNERKVCEWIEIGISYDADIDKALAIMQDEAMNHPYFYDNRTEAEKNRGNPAPAVQAKVLGFGDSSVNLRAWVWARNYPAGFNMRLDLYKSIKERFDEEGIEIPFPYRTLVFKDGPDSKLEMPKDTQ